MVHGPSPKSLIDIRYSLIFNNLTIKQFDHLSFIIYEYGEALPASCGGDSLPAIGLRARIPLFHCTPYVHAHTPQKHVLFLNIQVRLLFPWLLIFNTL